MAHPRGFNRTARGSDLMRATVNGVNMFYTKNGSGFPLVLLHGFPLDHTLWDPQVGFLSRKHTVVAPDLRGHGQTEPTPGVYAMELLARDVAALLTHLRLGPVVLAGLSMGGYVSLSFMRMFPERVKALMLFDTKAEADTEEARSRREQQAQAVLRNGVTELVDQMIVRFFTEKTAKERPDLVARVREVMQSTSPTGVAGVLRGMAERPDSTPLLTTIRVPTLIMVGSHDMVTTVEDAKRMAAGIEGSQLVIIPDAAHLTTLENPLEVNRAIDQFLSQELAA